MEWVRKQAVTHYTEFPEAHQLQRNVTYLRNYVGEIFKDEDHNEDGVISEEEFMQSYREIEEYELQDIVVSTKYKRDEL